jgi:aspartyl-tRNA(Asn)/glutamyl-tRNA(Gln) amidotransferase subunit C
MRISLFRETLARLSFREDELTGFISQLNQILQHVEKLNELDTTDIPPTSHMFFTRTPMREDKVRDEASPVAELIQNAPRRQEQFFVVPRVIE